METQRVWRAAALVALGVAVGGCGGSKPVQRVKFSEAAVAGARLDFSRPFMLEVEPGDRLPVHFEFSDQLFELQPAKPDLVLVAKRHGFVLIDGKRIVTSLNGEDFDVKPREPGRFRLGLAITRQGTWVEAVVVTPRHAVPGASSAPAAPGQGATP